MSTKTFSLVTGVVFLIIAVMHVLRVALGWHVTLGGWTLPMWVSWVAVAIAGFLAYSGLRLSRHP